MQLSYYIIIILTILKRELLHPLHVLTWITFLHKNNCYLTRSTQSHVKVKNGRGVLTWYVRLSFIIIWQILRKRIAIWMNNECTFFKDKTFFFLCKPLNVTTHVGLFKSFNNNYYLFIWMISFYWHPPINYVNFAKTNFCRRKILLTTLAG